MTVKNVIITGGSRGIGAATAEVFAQNGFNVIICYKTSYEPAEALATRLGKYYGIGAISVKADVSVTEDVKRLFDIAIDSFGPVDVLVNNAGVSQIKLLNDVSDSEIDDVIGTDLTGVIKTCREAISYMIPEHKGSIVNVSSMWGISGASCESVYSAAKGGVITFTKALSKEVGPSGIRVNCVCPGAIDTDMNKCLDQATRDELADSTSLCRLGDASEVAEAIYFLASDKASYITGQTLTVDGGFI